MVRIFDNDPAGNKAKRLSSINHTTKTISHHHQQLRVERLLISLTFCFNDLREEVLLYVLRNDKNLKRKNYFLCLSYK